MGGAGQTVGIVLTAGVFIGDDDGDGRTGGAALEHAAENAVVIRLPPGGIHGGGGSAAGKLAADIRLVHRQARGKAVQHHAHGGAMALAENGQGNGLAECVFHSVASRRLRISSGIRFSRRKVPGVSTSTVVMEPERAFLSCSR